MNTLVLALLLAQPTTAEPPVGDLSGHYACVGKLANGNVYRGACVIEQKGDIYIVTSTATGQASIGVGIRQGDKLAVSSTSESREGVTRSVAVYTIRGKSLSGRWASLPGSGAVCSETLTFVSELEEP